MIPGFVFVSNLISDLLEPSLLQTILQDLNISLYDWSALYYQPLSHAVQVAPSIANDSQQNRCLRVLEFLGFQEPVCDRILLNEKAKLKSWEYQ